MISRILIGFALVLAPAIVHAAGGVVSAADPRAAEAGREILRAGGSAADAAMAMMLALTVVEPQSSGIGGGGFLVHHDARTNAVATIDGRETAPAAARADRFVGADGKPMPFGQAYRGGLSVGVPGNVRLMARTHERWGKLKWARLFAPAIKLADGGFTVSKALETRLAGTPRSWENFSDARAIYWQDGAPKAAGTRVRNPALAKLLRTIAARGPDAFYTGANAAAISRAVGDAPVNATALTAADLSGYRAKDRDAVCAPYRGYRVCGMGPPSSGAITILQMLGLLERFDLRALGKESPAAWHLIGEAMRLAYADREKWLGDSDFVAVPVAGLLDRGYLAQRSALLSPTRIAATYAAGDPPGAEARTAAISSEVAGTTHFVAVDGAGNVASMTSTIEGPFGSQLIANGMFLNNELTDFSFAPTRDGAPVANAVAPAKRPLSSMAPTIVYDAQGRVVLALGSAGGKRIIMHVMKALVGVIDWQLPAADALALPNIYFNGNGLLVEAGTPLAALAPELTRLGQTVVVADVGSKLNAIERVGDSWRGAADPRSEGVALAE